MEDGALMEFLMTYGWAILVVLAAIGAAFYFTSGDLPSRNHSDSCNIVELGNTCSKVCEQLKYNNYLYSSETNTCGCYDDTKNGIWFRDFGGVTNGNSN